MIEESAKTESQKTKKIKKRLFLTKIIILVSMIIFGYFGFKYFQIISEQRSKAKAEVGKFDNIESEIFDLSDDYKNTESGDLQSLPDITVNELKEKGAEFIYHMLLKNQVQINDLKEQVQSLKADFAKYKGQEKIGKIIFSYIDLRQKIIADENYEDALKSFEMLVVFDVRLSAEVVKLKPLLKNYSDAKKLNKDFEKLIPKIIATKNNGEDQGFVAKVRHYISKLIVIRRVDGKNQFNVDGIVAKTEKLLIEQNYQEALNALLILDPIYHSVLADFLTELSGSLEVQKVDSEILLYLKNLSQ